MTKLLWYVFGASSCFFAEETLRSAWLHDFSSGMFATSIFVFVVFGLWAFLTEMMNGGDL